MYRDSTEPKDRRPGGPSVRTLMHILLQRKMHASIHAEEM